MADQNAQLIEPADPPGERRSRRPVRRNVRQPSQTESSMKQAQELLVVAPQIDHEEGMPLRRGAEVRLSSHKAGQERE
jgi:hypothetical protein